MAVIEAEVAVEAAEVSETEVSETEEAEAAQVAEVDSRKSGPHLPSSVDSSRWALSPSSRKFTPTPSQSRKPQSSTDSLPTRRLPSPTRSCASFPSKSKPRPVKEPDSRLSLPLVIDKVTAVLVSRSPRKSKLPSRVPSLTPR